MLEFFAYWPNLPNVEAVSPSITVAVKIKSNFAENDCHPIDFDQITYLIRKQSQENMCADWLKIVFL